MGSQDYTVIDLIKYAALFGLFYLVFQIVPSRWAEILTAWSSTLLLNLLGSNSLYGVNDIGVYMTLDGGARSVLVYIIRECSAIHVLGVIFGLVVPLKAVNASRKLVACILGASAVYVMNIIRISITLFLSANDVPPLSWFISNPTVETYHYPISFIFGVLGIIITILLMDRFSVPELGNFLASIPDSVKELIR